MNAQERIVGGAIYAALFFPSAAFAPDTCDLASVQQALEDEGRIVEAKSCDRDLLLDGYILSMKKTINNARQSQDFLGLDAGEADYKRGLQVTQNVLLTLEIIGANDSTTSTLVGKVGLESQAFMTPITAKPLSELDAAGTVAVCDAKLNWRRSKIWKKELNDCPIESNPSPPPDVEDEPPVHNDEPDIAQGSD